MRPQQVENLMNKLGRKKWNVWICKKVSSVDKVLDYLARYIRGGPISNRRNSDIDFGLSYRLSTNYNMPSSC
jgi:hypothetical protein